MADRAKKISELTAATGAANSDVMILVVNTAGTAVTKKIAFSNVVASVATVVSANLNVVASGRVAFGSNNNVITGSNNFTFDGSTVTITTNTAFGIAGSGAGLIRLLGAIASNVGPDIPNGYSLGNTTHAWAGLFVGTINAASLNVSGVIASGNTTHTGFVNVSSYGTFGGTVNAASLNVSGLTSISNTGLITAPQVGNIIPFYYANQAAFPSASSYHGALAHSHSDGKMYFAHGGSWNAIVSNGTTANVSGINISSNTINLNGVIIVSGSANTRLDVNTQIGSTGSNGSIYLSTAGKIYLKVANTGASATDWQRVTTTAVD